MKKILKSFLLITVMTVLCMAVAVTADAASSGGFTYEVVGGEATITGYTGNGGKVTVPSTLDGYTVTAIGDMAFMTAGGDTMVLLPAAEITELTLPDTIKNIGEAAFCRVNFSKYYRLFFMNGADAVESLSVFVPASVETIDGTAFTCLEAKGSNEKYTDININIFYGGSEAEWKTLYSDANIMREETSVDLEGADSSFELLFGSTVDSVMYTDKNTVKYNCTGISGDVSDSSCPQGGEHKWCFYDTYFECDEGGTLTYYCSNCNNERTEVIAPKAHSFGDTYPTAEELATHCGERDYWVQCQNCNHGEYLYLTGTAEHDWIREYDYSFNCLDGGYIGYYCNNCTQFKSEYAAPKAEHEWSDYPDISEFCGTREFDCYCVNCNRGMLIDVTGTAEHDWHKNDVNFTDCEEGGEIFYDCENCEEEKVVPIEPTSHTVAWYSNHDATCTEDGTKTSYCAVCDVEDFETVTDVGSALGHDYNSKWTVLTTATCTYPGISVRACKRCADIESQTTPAYGHFDNDEDGKCDECKVIIEIYAPNDPSIPADPPVYPGEPDDTHTDHTFGNWTEKDGIWYRVCSVCGYVESKVETEQGDVEIEYPQQPDCDFETEVIKGDEFILIELDVKENLGENIEVLKAFDITLKNSDGVHVQPDGTVKVKLPLDWDKDGNYKVYRVNDDGTYTDMEAYRQGSHMVFDTDHFSVYIVVEETEVTTPDTPDTPAEDPSEDCSCNCHKSGFMAFIWKILNFFYKLFKMNPVCKCGIAHY